MAGPAAPPSAVTLTPEGCSSADTAWAGCEQVPAWIVQGYQTLLDEIDTELGGTRDLVAVPVGVGSLAEAVVRHYRRLGAAHPSVLSVEPDTAACVLSSLTAARATTVATAATVLTGLNCGTVSRSAWPVLRVGCDAAVAVSDQDALGLRDPPPPVRRQVDVTS
jgi:diaminopropionate ammonia-lyase